MFKLRKTYFEGRYGQIHAYIAGEEHSGKLPLYCAHQSPKSGAEFSNFMRAAGEERLVIAPDYPGYGMSDRPHSESETTVDLYAQEMWAVVDQMGHEKVDLFGNHTGAKVIAAMAMSQPERVGSLVMISAALLTPEEREMFGNMFQPIPLDDEGTRYSTMWERIIERRSPGVTYEMLGESMALNLMGGEAYEWGHHAAFSWPHFETALRTLDHRITILNPNDDLTEATSRAGPMLKNGEVVDLPDWVYNFMDVWPDETAKLVLSKL
jgi:pimeloyl-ACP methyl ester carboxylesterase|tara:strand:- start:95085 stop:95882 length:798 start_codon:yes stop_codon:yes gene_type:complete